MGAQLDLPLDHAPAMILAHGLSIAHPRPLVSLGKRPGQPFSSFRTTPDKAWRFPEVQYGNAGSSIAALVLDCDKPAAFARGLPDLPPPNWTVWRRSNCHAHIAWTLAEPVHRYPAARIEPLRYLANVADYYGHAVGADPGFAGVLAHNPAPRYRQDQFHTTWGRRAPYTLDQLASVVPFGWEKPAVRQTAIGRNLDMFEAGMRWAGRRENAHLPVPPALMAIYDDILALYPKADHAYTLAEVQATARKIERYRADWAARGWHSPRWIARQAARGRKGGRPRLYEPGCEPWTLGGISRRTWERRRARERDAKANTDKRAQPSAMNPREEGGRS